MQCVRADTFLIKFRLTLPIGESSSSQLNHVAYPNIRQAVPHPPHIRNCAKPHSRTRNKFHPQLPQNHSTSFTHQFPRFPPKIRFLPIHLD